LTILSIFYNETVLFDILIRRRGVMLIEEAKRNKVQPTQKEFAKMLTNNEVHGDACTSMKSRAVLKSSFKINKNTRNSIRHMLPSMTAIVTSTSQAAMVMICLVFSSKGRNKREDGMRRIRSEEAKT